MRIHVIMDIEWENIGLHILPRKVNMDKNVKDEKISYFTELKVLYLYEKIK